MIYIQEFAVQLGDSRDHECDKILGGKNYYGHLLLLFAFFFLLSPNASGFMPQQRYDRINCIVNFPHRLRTKCTDGQTVMYYGNGEL